MKEKRSFAVNLSGDIKEISGYLNLGKFNLDSVISDWEYVGDRDVLRVSPNYFCKPTDILFNWKAISEILEKARDIFGCVSININLAENRFAPFADDFRRILLNENKKKDKPDILTDAAKLLKYVADYFIENGQDEVTQDDVEHCIMGATDAMIDLYNGMHSHDQEMIVDRVNGMLTAFFGDNDYMLSKSCMGE